MTVRRLAAITLIFFATCVAWGVLSSSLLARTGQFDGRLNKEVEQQMTARAQWDQVFGTEAANALRA